MLYKIHVKCQHHEYKLCSGISIPSAKQAVSNRMRKKRTLHIGICKLMHKDLYIYPCPTVYTIYVLISDSP